MVKLFSENLKLLCDANYCKLFEEWRWRWITTPNDDNNIEVVYDVDPTCGSLIIDHYPMIYHHLPTVGGQNHVVGEAHDVTGIWSPLIVRITSNGAPFGFPMVCLARGKMLSPWRVMSCWCCCANGHMRWGDGRKMLSLKVSTSFTVCYFFSFQKNMDGEISLHVVKERIRVLFKWLTLLNDQAP